MNNVGILGSIPRTLVYCQRVDNCTGSYQHIVSRGGDTSSSFGSYIDPSQKFGYWLRTVGNLLSNHISYTKYWEQWTLTYTADNYAKNTIMEI